jgi:hypothetical protein
VSRAAGVILLVMAVSSVLSWPVIEPSMAWTSSLATNVIVTSDLTTQLHAAYSTVFSSPGFYLPSATQGIAGLAMILFSRRVGRWLAGGLSDHAMTTRPNKSLQRMAAPPSCCMRCVMLPPSLSFCR